MARPSVVIVGGGIAGLAAAWELTGAERGPDATTPRVELIEAAERVGGSLGTVDFADRLIDTGPDGFLARRPEATQLIDELGLTDQLEAVAASGASIWLRGQLEEIPPGLALGVPASSATVRAVHGLSWRARLAARRDELVPRHLVVGDDASIGAIVRAKLGAEIAYRFVEPMVGGIQAGRIDELSARALFPSLLDAARANGSLMRALAARSPAPVRSTTAPAPLFASLRGGVGSLAPALAAALVTRGVAVRTATRVIALRATPRDEHPWAVDTNDTTTPAHALIIATPGAVAGDLLHPFHPDLGALRTITSAGAAMVTVCVERGALRLPERGTGVLIPLATAWTAHESMMVTALTFLDRKWPRLAREDTVVLRAHVGRSDDARWAEMDDAALVERVTHEMARVLPGFPPVREALVSRFPAGLPQYRVGHVDLVAAARAGAPRGVLLAGNAYDGVGIPASIGSGRRAARELVASLASRETKDR